MGGTASSIISFILPGMFLLQMEGEAMDRFSGNGADGIVSEEEGEGYLWLLLTSSENPSTSPLLIQFSPSLGHFSRRRKLLLVWDFILGGTLMDVFSTGDTLYGLYVKNDDDAAVGGSCSTMSGSDRNIPSNSGRGGSVEGSFLGNDMFLTKTFTHTM